uniref:Uncharacterized protein n=1 Tax=Oryza nivara TaxID=4536 RepID=A0A0E0J819_ORYNI
MTVYCYSDLVCYGHTDFGQKGLHNSVKPTKQNKFTNVVQINGGTFPESLFLDALKVTVSPRYGPFNAVETEIEVFHIKRQKRIRSEARKLYNANVVNSLKFPIEEGTGPDNPQL